MEGYALESDAKKDNLEIEIKEKGSPDLTPNKGSESEEKRRVFDIRRQPKIDPGTENEQLQDQPDFNADDENDEMDNSDQDINEDFVGPIAAQENTPDRRYYNQNDMDQASTTGQNENKDNAPVSPVDKANAEPDKQQTPSKPIEQANATPPEVKHEFDKSKEKPGNSPDKGASKSESDSNKGAKKIGAMAKDALAAVRGNFVAAIKLGATLLKDKKTRWIIIGALIISGTLTVMAILIPLSFLGGIGGNVSLLGKTLPQAVSPTEDKDLISNSLKLLGNSSITQAQTDELVDRNAKEILRAIEDANTKDPTGKSPIAVKGQVAIDSGNVLKANRTQKNAQTYIKNVGIFLSANQNLIPKFDGSTQKPTKSTELTFNDDLHGGSFQRKEQADSNSIYSANNKGTCDAVDISTSMDEAIFPIFGGKVLSVSSDEQNGQIVRIQNGDYIATYAHLQKPIEAKGQNIGLDTQLGLASGNNIQIEIVYKNKCLVTTSSDMLDYRMKDRKHAQIGGYLWDHILETFNLG